LFATQSRRSAFVNTRGQAIDPTDHLLGARQAPTRTAEAGVEGWALLPRRKLSLFVALALTDLALTWLLLKQAGGGAYEWNPLASWWLARFGWGGLALFKLGIVGMIGLVSWIVSRHRPRVADRLLTFACAAHLAVIIYSSLLVPRVMAQASQTAQAQALEQELHFQSRQFQDFRRLLDQLGKDLVCRRRSLAEAVTLLSSTEWVQRPQWQRCMALRYPTFAKKELLAALLIGQAVVSAEASPNGQTDLYPRLEAEFRCCFGRPSPYSLGGGAQQLPVRPGSAQKRQYEAGSQVHLDGLQEGDLGVHPGHLFRLRAGKDAPERQTGALLMASSSVG
jgi:hypothetical protein